MDQMDQTELQWKTMENEKAKRLQAIIEQQKVEIFRLKKIVDSLSKNIQPDNKSYLSINKIITDMPGYVYWKDKNSIYRGCNKNVATLSDLKRPGDICGMRDKDFSRGQSQFAEFIQDDLEVIEKGIKKVAVHKLSVKNKDKGLVYLKTEKVPLKAADGSIQGMLGVAMDITEQKAQTKTRPYYCEYARLYLLEK